MFDIICVGGVTHDIFFKSKFEVNDSSIVFPWKGKTVVEEMDVSLGGGGANAAVGFSRLGLNTSLLCRVGTGYTSNAVIKSLTEEKVDTSLIIRDKNSHTATSLIFLDTASGEHSIVMYRGKNDYFSFSEVDINKVLNAKWLYVADLAASEDKNDFIRTLVETACSKGIKVAFTPSKRQLSLGLKNLEPIINKLEVMILNQSEWDLLTESIPVDRAHELGAKLTVITKDVRGVTACQKDLGCFSNPAPKVERVVDTTGAGDAFASGLIAALIKEKPAEEALHWGTLNAGSVIGKVSSQAGLLCKIS